MSENVSSSGRDPQDDQNSPSDVGAEAGGSVRGTEESRNVSEPKRLTREQIVWAYRLFLDRDPETEEAILAKQHAWGTTQDLRRDILSSPEFRDKNPPVIVHTPAVVIAELGDSLRLFVNLTDLAIGLSIIRSQYEESEIAFVRQVVQPGETVLDIGANIGFFSITLGALVGPTGRVYAFEPLAQNADLLERSIRENGMSDRIILKRVLVGETPGEGSLVFLPLDRGSLNSGGGHLQTSPELIPVGHEVQRIPMVSLDAERLEGRVGFVKIDVEGAEPLVIRGAKKLLRTDRPIVLCEINTMQLRAVADCPPHELLFEMAGLGYACWTLQNGKLAFPLRHWDDDFVGSVVFVPLEEQSSLASLVTELQDGRR